MLNRKNFIFGIILLPVFILGLKWCFYGPEKAYAYFLAIDLPEEMIEFPLVVADGRVNEILIQKIKDSKIPPNRRRYAIDFLGWKGVLEAVDPLSSIAADKKEEEYIRLDALTALYRISPSIFEIELEKISEPVFQRKAQTHVRERPDASISFYDALLGLMFG
jgi:hypothetical protein